MFDLCRRNGLILKWCAVFLKLGNHETSRVSSRIGEENVDLANSLNMLLGGTAIVYYGEEIGMQDLPRELLDFEHCQDEFGKKHGVSFFEKVKKKFIRVPPYLMFNIFFVKIFFSIFH